MRLVIAIFLVVDLCISTLAETYIDELLNDQESDENTVVAAREIVKRNVDERNEAFHENNPLQVYHLHKPRNVVSDDLMVQASPAAVYTELIGTESKEDVVDLMGMRKKRETKRERKREIKQNSSKDNATTFKRIYDFITSKDMMSPMSNERRSELTAKATNSKGHAEKRDDTKSEMSSIFSGIQASKHHKLTRSDIRKLAKKAVMLATLKKLDEVKTKNEAMKNNTTYKSKSAKKKVKISKNPKKSKNTKKKIEKSVKKVAISSVKAAFSVSGKEDKQEKTTDNIADTLNVKETKLDKINDNFGVVLKDSVDMKLPISSEMSEDLSRKSEKKSNIDGLLTDDKMNQEKAIKENLTDIDITNSLKPKDEPKAEDLDDLFASDKKNIIEKPDEEKKMGDLLIKDATTTDPIASVDLISELSAVKPTKKSELPSSYLNDQIERLRYALSKSSPNKVPDRFFPDLPAGIRMIAWKKLLVKKKNELEQLEATLSNSDASTSDVTDSKPVMINIDIDQDKTEKEAMAALATKDIEKTNTGDKTSSHIHYLQKHIKGARALRKLIAKTLIGHCKTTGKRILRAFVAMDKALARAQAIANVIGRKFKIDSAKIDALVGDKEDQVVETFLRDIFTKI